MRTSYAPATHALLALAALQLTANEARADDRLVPGQYGTIQAALDAAHDGDRILIAPGTYTGPGNRDLDTLGKQVAVLGAGASATVIDCLGSSSAPHGGFTISGGGAAVSIEDLSVIGAFRPRGGALVIRGSAAPRISNCAFSNNTATVRGGAVSVEDSAAPHFNGCELTFNSAPAGGALQVEGTASASLQMCSLRSNTASGSGGGLFASMSANLYLEGVHVLQNRALGGWGGGLRLESAGAPPLDFFANNCLIQDNEAQRGGGFCGTGAANIEMRGTSFVRNYASTDGGGGVFADGASVLVVGSNWFSNSCNGSGGALVVELGAHFTWDSGWVGLNSAGLDGGGVHVGSPTSELRLIHVAVSANSAGRSGGGLSVLDSQQISTLWCFVHNNTAMSAGGMLLGNGARAWLDNGAVSYNCAMGSHGGVRVDSGAALTATNLYVEHNTAGEQAAGVSVEGATAALRACVVNHNSAQLEGGGVVAASSSQVLLERCRVSANSASRGAGLLGDGGSTLTVDCTDVLENHASDRGAGAFVQQGATLWARCSSWVRNAAPNSGGGACVANASALFSNSIVWANEPDSIDGASGAVSAAYCDVAGGFPGVGNIDADPLFVALELGVLQLRHGSPCIDAGDGALAPAGLDLDNSGLPRFSDDPLTPDTGPGAPPVVDIGAHEYADQPTIYCISPLNANSCYLTMSFSGVPYASPLACSSGPFTIYGNTAINNKTGMLFWGVSGRQETPWNGGALCARGPLKRTPLRNSGGNPPPANDCSGTFSINFNLIACWNPALSVGTTVNAQWWGRVPNPNGQIEQQISDGIEFVLH